ncbi:rod shape-determining protein [Streptomyces galbus]|uniref:Rod shape-determining protein n=1 Tax=Streptomyces galbus TaxID=33898 RepID=A0A4U5X0X4_STRGB|nr:rod shape-determining protein [Streptomyces galbus]TKT07982.1 rod shape-determining protein [Streptomyces galbus]GHD42098.1 hypothetical protein GCM10010335_44570 [Streptomyces galbus]
MTGDALLPHPAERHRPWSACRRCCGVALDLGSARTRAWVSGRGVVVDVPTVTFLEDGARYPVRRGAVVDVAGCAEVLRRALGHRLPRGARPLVVVAAPALDAVAFRTRARAVAGVLGPRAVLTVPGARAVALAAGADLSRPLLVVDVGAHFTEVVLLSEGAVTDARRVALGTGDLGDTVTAQQIAGAVATMLTAMLRQDRGSLCAEAVGRGLLLAGGGALRPEVTYRLTGRLPAPVRVVPAPHTAAVRGAAKLLAAARTHPSAAGAGR